MRAKIYEKVYSVEAQEFDNLSTKKLNTFIFQGSKNWDFYFPEAEGLNECEIACNVALLKTKDKNEFESYLQRYQKHKVIDYSIEHDPVFYILVDKDA